MPNEIPLAVSVTGTCALTNLGKTKVYELINDGRLDTISIGRRRLVKVDSIYRLLGASSC